MKYKDFSVKINSESTIFIFTVYKKRTFYEFSTCPKGLKCNILVWNYGEDVTVLRSNWWHHLLRWRNAFSACDVRWTITDCSIFLDRFLAFHRFKCYLGSFSRYITVFFTQYYTPLNTLIKTKLTRNGKKKKKKRRVGRSLIIANKSIKETEILIFFRVRSNFISLMNTKTCILVSIRWNKMRSHTEKKKKKKKILFLLLLYFSISNISTINWRTGTLSSEVMWLYRK